MDGQQSDSCDGVAAVDPAQQRLLDKDAAVRSAVVCTQDYADLPGRGRWQVQRLIDLPAASIPALVRALTLPDVHQTGGACDASGRILPGLVLTLADGTRIRPGLPGDGCHVRTDVVEELGRLTSSGTVRTTVPISQVASERSVSTGCGDEAKSPAIWLSAGHPVPGGGVTALPASVTVCRYAADAEPELGTLDATGTATGPSVTALIAHLDSAPPTGCPANSTPETSPATNWLAVQTPPSATATAADQPTPGPLLLVETGGCRRVVDVAHFTVLGHLSADGAARLAALASQPTG